MKNLRKSICLSLFAIVSTSACFASPDQHKVDVTDVKSGLVCHYKIGNKGEHVYDPHVCFETEDILITGQGLCTFDGERKPCTWHGFEFDFNNRTNAPVVLTCYFSANYEAVLGNPKGIEEDPASGHDILLKPGIGHISNPQYTLFRHKGLQSTPVNINRCEIEGRVVFESRFNLILPARP